MNWSAPPEIADLHPEVDGWNRRHAWIKARKNGHFEAVYTKGAETRRVVVAANVLRHVDGSQWAVKGALKARRRSKVRTTRANRPKPIEIITQTEGT